MPFLGLATKGDTDALKSMIGQVNALAQTLDHSTKQLNDMSEKSISDFLPEGMAILPKVEEGMTCLQFDRCHRELCEAVRAHRFSLTEPKDDDGGDQRPHHDLFHARAEKKVRLKASLRYV
eukprot:scaffold238402_cov23-Tisochrysis_lutea.AAC.1